MRFAVGLLDWLFGEKTMLEVPIQNGTIHKVRVTIRWIEQMKQEGKITPADKNYVQVHVLDPMRGQYVTQWVIGENIPHAKYEEFVDPKTQALYAITHYEAGQPKTMVVRKNLWDQAKKQFDAC